MRCERCNTENKEGSRFCMNCGNEMKIQNNDSVEKEIFCTKCGTSNSENSSFCRKCGEKLNGKNKQGKNKQGKNKQGKNKQGKNKQGKNKIVLGALAGIFVIALLASLIFIVFTGYVGKKEENCFFIKDGSLYSISAKKVNQNPKEYAGKNITLYDSSVQVSPNGKYVCYTDYNNSNDSDKNCLYMAEIGKKNGKNVKIDENVSFFDVLDDKVIFLDYNEGLYVSNIKGEKEKVASNVARYFLDKKGKNVVWEKSHDYSDGGKYSTDVYCRNMNLKKEKQKIASGVSICGVSENLDKIYLKDESDTLYLVNDMTKIKTIDNNVDLVYMDDNLDYSKRWTDIIFYTKVSQKEGIASDIINFDYYLNLELSEDERGWIEEEMNDPFPYDVTDLYCYDGKASTLVETEIYNVLVRDEKGIVYNKGSIENMEKVSMFEVENTDEEYIPELFKASYEKTLESYFYCDKKKVQLDETIDFVKFNTQSGIGCGLIPVDWDTYEYEATNVSMYGAGSDLYRFTANEESNGAMQFVDNDVVYIESIQNNDIYYVKYDGINYNLYMNQKLIEENLYVDTIQRVGGRTYYLEGETGDLKCYDGKKTDVLADDVLGGFDVKNENEIFYLTNYDFDRGQGDLMFFDGKKSKLIVEDVSDLISEAQIE